MTFTYMKCNEFERRFGLENSVIIKPSFRFEILGIVSPYVLHSSHNVRNIVDTIPFIQLETIRKNVMFQDNRLSGLVAG